MFWFLLLTHSVLQTLANPSERLDKIIDDDVNVLLNITVAQKLGHGACKFTNDCGQHSDCVNIQVIFIGYQGLKN